MAQECKEAVGNGTSASAAMAVGASSAGGFKFNIDAPEFIPQAAGCAAGTAVTAGFPQYYSSPYIHFAGSGTALGIGPDWSFFAGQEPVFFLPEFPIKFPTVGQAAKSSTASGGDVMQKIIKQVEYQFSDTNLVANDFLMKIMNKDPEGYVPMSVIASWKKIKALGANNHMIIKALRTSSKLSVSDDGKKVRRKQLFTERDKEELQSRTIIVENLPEDYSRSNLEKIFNVVGSVKNIRVCHPQEPSSARSSKSDVLISNKLHALVEYETSEQADKAVEKLNDERNWRKGLRVRPMLRRSPRSVIRSKRPDFDIFDMNSEDESPRSQQSSGSPMADKSSDQNMEESPSSAKKGRGRGRAKPFGAPPSLLSPQSSGNLSIGEPLISKQSPQGPRMPDGTRGFTMGRGRPTASLSRTSSLQSAPGLASVQT